MKKLILLLFIVLSSNVSAQNGVLGVGMNTLNELTMSGGVLINKGFIVDFSVSFNLEGSVTHMDGYYSPWPGDEWQGQYEEDNIQIGLNYGKIFNSRYVIGGGLSYRREVDLPIYVEKYVVFSPNGLYTIDSGNNIYESIYPSLLLGIIEKKIFIRGEFSIKSSNITIGIIL
jgi:hypothetical protein